MMVYKNGFDYRTKNFVMSSGRVMEATSPLEDWRPLCPVIRDRCNSNFVFFDKETEKFGFRICNRCYLVSKSVIMFLWAGDPGTYQMGDMIVMHDSEVMWISWPEGRITFDPNLAYCLTK